MSEIQDKIEISEHKNRNYVLYGALIGLVMVVQGFYTYVVSSTGNEMRANTQILHDMVTNVKVQQAQLDFMKQEIADLQNARKDAGAVHEAQANRLKAVEQSIALHDQWIQAHNK